MIACKVDFENSLYSLITILFAHDCVNCTRDTFPSSRCMQITEQSSRVGILEEGDNRQDERTKEKHSKVMYENDTTMIQTPCDGRRPDSRMPKYLILSHQKLFVRRGRKRREKQLNVDFGF